MKRDIEKQEAVVEELWKFASNIQHDPYPDCTAEDGTRLRLRNVTITLRNILATFGYDVLEIQ